MQGLDYISRIIQRFVDEAPINAEEKIRLQHYAILLLLGIPTMMIFGILGVVQGRYLMSTLIFLSGAGLSIGLYILGRTGKSSAIFRINSFLFSLLLIYLAAVGGDDGSKILWMYTFPLITLFLMGRREGLLWAAGTLALCTLILFVPLPRLAAHQYPIDFKIRFMITYVFVTIIAFWFENLRQKYHDGMIRDGNELMAEKTRLLMEIIERRKTEQEKIVLIEQLQEALMKVKVLSGFLPICAQCKKIRDNEGNWNQLESYIRDRSGVEFSHGYCPECAAKLLKDLHENS